MQEHALHAESCRTPRPFARACQAAKAAVLQSIKSENLDYHPNPSETARSFQKKLSRGTRGPTPFPPPFLLRLSLFSSLCAGIRTNSCPGGPAKCYCWLPHSSWVQQMVSNASRITARQLPAATSRGTRVVSQRTRSVLSINQSAEGLCLHRATGRARLRGYSRKWAKCQPACHGRR